jgi:hypothetical protein
MLAVLFCVLPLGSYPGLWRSCDGSGPGAGFQNGFDDLPLTERVTHPSNHGFPDATFDYVFAKGLTASQPTVAHASASDHWLVTRDFRLH